MRHPAGFGSTLQLESGGVRIYLIGLGGKSLYPNLSAIFQEQLKESVLNDSPFSYNMMKFRYMQLFAGKDVGNWTFQ